MSKKIQSKTTFNTNFNTSINLGKTVAKKETNNISIPLLKDCAKYTSDPFWKKKLNEASLGIFPKFFSYKDEHLIYTNGINKTKLNSQKMKLSTEPKISCDIFVTFLKEKGKIFSPNDTQNLVQIEFPEETGPKIWSMYKKKDKEHMIDLYVEQMKIKLSLSEREENELYRRILEGLNAGVFKGKTIKEIKTMKIKNAKENQEEEHIVVDSDNRILLIKGINFSSKTRRFTFDEKIEKQIYPKMSHKENVPINYKRSNNIISSKWKKYLEILDKNKKKQEPIVVNIDENEDIADISDIDL